MPNSLGAILLPNDLTWIDEFNWSSVGQNITVTIGGALVIEESALLAGRPITLAGADDGGWIDRATLLQLRALAEVPAASYTLTLLDGRQFNVAFARPSANSSSSNSPGGSSPISAKPVVPFSAPADGDFYVITLSLMTV